MYLTKGTLYKVPGSSRVPWWLGLAPATLEFWVRFPNERNQGKLAYPVLKYRVSHGSHSFFHTISLPPAFTSA